MTKKNTHLRKTFAESYRAILGKRPKNDTFWRQLRGSIWLDYIFQDPEWTWEKLARELGQNRSRSNIVSKWKEGSASPYRVSAIKLKNQIPGSFALFELPMWTLLKNAPKSVRDIRRLTSVYDQDNCGLLPDEIDNCTSVENAYRHIYPDFGDASDALVMEGSLRAFNELIVRVRMSEAKFKDIVHSEHIANLYHMLPCICKLPYFANNYVELSEAIVSVHQRVEHSTRMIGVNWNVINDEICKVESEIQREARIRKWLTGNGTDDRCPVRTAKSQFAPTIGSPSYL